MDKKYKLDIAEMFHSVTGEGFDRGTSAVFLRLQYCTLLCKYCDTVSVWKKGKPWKTDDLLKNWEEREWISKLERGDHLVLTGGSPILQQNGLLHFLNEFYWRFSFKPFVEIENECTLMPDKDFVKWINQWNNSPKLLNSGMTREKRYRPEILQWLAKQKNSWFKFVVSNPSDIVEILNDFIKPKLIKREQVILMPECSTREELIKNSEWVVNYCKQYGFKFSSRDQLLVWDKTTGV